MVHIQSKNLTLEEFLASPLSGDRYELVNGEAIPKEAPQRHHSRTRKALLLLLENWNQSRGEVGLKWSAALKRHNRDWATIPDLLYVSFDRLPSETAADNCPSPIPPDLTIEIISPDQTFGALAEKATDYLTAGVLRVWVVDPRDRSITVFAPDSLPAIYRGDGLCPTRGHRPLTDDLFPGLKLTAAQVFEQAGLSPQRLSSSRLFAALAPHINSSKIRTSHVLWWGRLPGITL
jgi:Uma2 family endonuclease